MGMHLGRFLIVLYATMVTAHAEDKFAERGNVHVLARAQQSESLEQALALTKRHQDQLKVLLDEYSNDGARRLIEKRLETLASEKQSLDRQRALLSLREGDDELVIQALIDGHSTLLVEAAGLHWSVERFAKLGQHQGPREPTYVNGLPWQPIWYRSEKTHGSDISRLYPFRIDLKSLRLKSATISIVRNGNPLPPSEAVKVSKQGGVMTINIPDNDGGSRWYTIRLSGS